MDELTLASLLTDHVVLQRGRPHRLWGWDRPGQRIVLTVDDGPGPICTVAATDGSWSLDCPELAEGGPYRLRIRGSTERVLEDVLVGEVWLASGQSNMEWPLKAASGGRAEAERAGQRQIRMFKVANATARRPARQVGGQWRVSSPEHAGDFSAVGYCFAREVHHALGVPVGIIDASWGGTRVEAWTSASALAGLMEIPSTEPTPEELASIAGEYAATLREWEARHLHRDPGNTGESAGLARPEHDDANWRPLSLPGYWQTHGMSFNGAVWFRRRFAVPAEWAGHDLVLSLGAIDDFDHTYFNGTLVGCHPQGTPNAYRIPRRYRVPGSLVRSGHNTVAVRVFDHAGEGGFAGPADAMSVASTGPRGEPLSLAGEWRCWVEHELPLLPAGIWGTLPQPPYALNLQNAPSALFHGMIAPLVPFGIRGAIWYQGESNVDQHRDYRERFATLIRDYRTRWGLGTFPFLFVQLASYGTGEVWPYLREAQAECLSEPVTGMAVTLDLGEQNDVHPRNKREVGRRLALLALAIAYRRELECSGPMLDRVEIVGSTVRVHWAHARGLCTSDQSTEVTGFTLAGPDRQYHAARGSIEGETVVVTSGEVPAPVSVRYAWHDCPVVNLINASGLPAAPFRTDRY